MADGAIGLERRAHELAGVLPPLLVAAERVASTVVQGAHGRRRAGPGETFWQFRRYQPGDAVTAIDWRKSAKADPLLVREKEWAAAQAVWLWVDGSPSMRWRSAPDLPTKLDRAAVLALALAVLLVRTGERVALAGDARPPASGRAVPGRLAESLSNLPPGPGLPPPAPLPRHAHAVLFGDFLAEPAETETALRALAGRGVRGHLVQVLDPAEESLPYHGRMRFTGLEHEGEWLASRAEDLRDAYQARLAAHRQALSGLARRLGWSFALHHTDRPPQAALLALHTVLADR